ncbi:MAG: hypothetical protein Q7U75_07345 [Desulfobacterales bacterium]|nr:hypothetical protein [Desulfobacterales bacterium]
MGTQAIYGFRKDGRDRLTVMNNSGYPTYFGVKLLEYLRGQGPTELAETCDRIVLISTGQRPTPQQVIDHLALARIATSVPGLGDMDLGSAAIDDTYNLLREAQGDLSVYEPGSPFYLMEDYGQAMAESFWNDWAYVINLDTGMLEIYLGHNTDPTAPGRYSGGGSPWVSEASQTRRLDGSVERTPERTYYGMALLAEYPIASLPGNPQGWAQTLEGMSDVSYRLRWADIETEYPDGTVKYGIQEED